MGAGTAERSEAEGRNAARPAPQRRPVRIDAPWVMIRAMRMTISMEDGLAEHIRREARARGLSVSAFIAKTLDDALKPPESTQAEAVSTDLRLAAKARSRALNSTARANSRPARTKSATADGSPPRVSNGARWRERPGTPVSRPARGPQGRKARWTNLREAQTVPPPLS